jgi:hypothetical protein
MKNLIAMTLLLALTYAGISQTALITAPVPVPDSITCLPNYQLRGAIKKIEGAKILEQELSGCKFSKMLMERIIKVADSTIREAKKADSTQQARINVIKADRDNMTHQRDAALVLSGKMEGALQRQKNITLTIAGVGIAVSTTLFILLIHR